ncbi:MAG: radical SAM protein [Alistipes sp.]|nr:radical SAM protein [Alistipes sp.]
MHYVKAKGILSSNNKMNLYRGCLHGCIYCDSRSRCYHMEHDFEDIEVKENAVELLENVLRHKRKKCMIGTGAMTDPYIPLEMETGNVRKVLSLIDEYGFGFTVITKSDRILRDLDLLKKINDKTKCVVQMTMTTFDEALCGKIEPNVCTTKRRFEVLKILRDEGIPTVVWLCPILPFINDTEENISGILDYCIEAKVYGVICYGMGLTLREGNREYFYEQLDRLFPGLKEKYIRTYKNQYIVDSPDNERLMRLFYQKCRENGMVHNNEDIFRYLREFEEKQTAEQLSLWDIGNNDL